MNRKHAEQTGAPRPDTLREFLTSQIFLPQRTKLLKRMRRDLQRARAAFFAEGWDCNETITFTVSPSGRRPPAGRFWAKLQSKSGCPTNDGDD